MFLTLSLVFGCACFTSAQILSSGPCPNNTVEQNLHLTAYLGQWYEAKRIFALFQQSSECTSDKYGLNEDGTISVSNHFVDASTGDENTILGFAEMGSYPDESKWLLSIPSVGSLNFPCWVLGTDYQSYSVIWSCAEIGSSNIQYSWLLTRERFPDAATLDSAYQVMIENGLTPERFMEVKQENCPAVP